MRRLPRPSCPTEHSVFQNSYPVNDSARKIQVMLTAAKEGTFSASSDPCVFFPLAASEGVPKNSRLGFARKNPAPHQGSAWSNSGKALGIEEVVWEICGGSDDSARYYDVQTGRFLNEDSIGFGGGINFYAYVVNDPLNLEDPFGHNSTTIGPVTIPLPWTRCTSDAWYCTDVMTPTQIAAEDAHEADHRLRWRDHIPGWVKEKLGFQAEIPILKKRISELEAKGCLSDAEKRDLEGARKQLEQAAPIASWDDDYAAKFYWNENVRRWWQKRVSY